MKTKAKRQILNENKKFLLEVQGGKCKNCRIDVGNIYDIDHIIPFSISEDNSISNLQLLCPNCHAQKTRGCERKKIKIFKSTFNTKYPHCWNCFKRVSPFFFNGIMCKSCDKKILEENLSLSLENFHIS